MAQFGRALGLGPRGRRFESCHPEYESMQILHLHGFPLEKRSERSMKKNLKMILLAAGIIAVIVFELWLWLYVVSV